MRARDILWTGFLAAAVLVSGGCGKEEKGQAGSGRPVSMKEKKEKLEAIKKEMERLKAEMVELQRQAEATESELKKAQAPQGE